MSGTAESKSTGYDMDTAAMEQLLITGREPELLKAYLGEAEYEELCDLARQASRQASEAAHVSSFCQVCLGHRLASRASSSTNIIWFDPVSIIKGEIAKLPLRGPVLWVSQWIFFLFSI